MIFDSGDAGGAVLVRRDPNGIGATTASASNPAVRVGIGSTEP